MIYDVVDGELFTVPPVCLFVGDGRPVGGERGSARNLSFVAALRQSGRSGND